MWIQPDNAWKAFSTMPGPQYMLNKCLLRKNKKAKTNSRAPFLPQSPQSIKAALLSQSLGPKGNQTQQLQLCLPGPIRPACLGFSGWGPPLPCRCGRGKNADAVTWPWTFPQASTCTKAFLLPQQCKQHPAQHTLPMGSPQNSSDPCRIVHLPGFAACTTAGQQEKNERKFCS